MVRVFKASETTHKETSQNPGQRREHEHDTNATIRDNKLWHAQQHEGIDIYLELEIDITTHWHNQQHNKKTHRNKQE